MLQLHMNHLDAVNVDIARIDKEVDANVEPFRVACEMLTTIPGVRSLAAEVIVAEIGIDMSRFETEGHLISRAGLCPKNAFIPSSPEFDHLVSASIQRLTPASNLVEGAR